MEAAAGKNSTTLLSSFMETFGLEVDEECYGYPDLGRRDTDWQMVIKTKRSWVKPGSRSSDVEASERSGGGSGVRDP